MLTFQNVKLTIRPTFILVILGFVLINPKKSNAQLIVGDVDPYILVTNVLVGKGIETKNIIYTGHKQASCFFENGLETALKMDAGIILASGIATSAKGPNGKIDNTQPLNGFKYPGSALLDLFTTVSTKDAVTLQFDFRPQTEDIFFNYIFASEEYPEYVDKGVSDIFGFFISGPGILGEQNVALVPGNTAPVSIDNVNHKRNTQFFHLNTLGEKTLQADGYTTTLTANLKLTPCEFYTIKLAIADVGDYVYDSYVFIESGSFQHKTLVGRDTFICAQNFDIELNAGHPGKKVKWKKDGIDIDTTQKIRVNSYGVYEVEVFTDCGSFIAKKKILPGVKPISLGKDTLFCGDTLNYLIEVENRKFDKYLWSNGSTNETLMATKPGKYWLEIERDGCKQSDTIILFSEPLPKVDLGNDTVVCGTVDLFISAKEIANNYTWYLNNTLLPETSIRLRADKPGKYSEISKNLNCGAKDSIFIGQRTAFKLDIGPPIREICENDSISFRTGIRDTSYDILWNTGDKSSYINVNTSGNYIVNVRDKKCNYQASDSVFVKVYEGAGNVWVPNAFTPGPNDELNNLFKPFSDITNFNYYRFMVFNRWGEKLFETNNPKAAWDGYYKGQLSENDVYIWSLNVKTNCSKGDNNFQRGIVHLIR